ncbi:Ubiquitin-specific protease family c19 protein [Thalictrum thalictroides]|uniref:Ubiquitin-specific protease family c19 protein n=1 Tax=Thalictrum thalictroides TaxID=46969 RepID=A0A7J6WAX1_THATH|nr:Ubiquitin-specific protease family c19 protein [Thalictrum thalictroides]
MGSRGVVPYTGGDVKKSGELGKMFDIPTLDPSSTTTTTSSTLNKPSRPSSSSQHNSGSLRSGSNSGPQLTKSSNSGSFPLQPTGLITSGGVQWTSGSGGVRRSAQLEPSVSMGKTTYGAAVTSIGEDMKFGFKVSKAIMWVFGIVVLMGLVVGVFMMATVKNAIILVAVGAVIVPVLVVLVWNCAWRKRGLLGFVNRYPDAELRSAKDGQFVKVTGVVTCGSIPLESSYQRVPRCAYVSTELYEYKGWGGRSANSKHCPFSWGLRYFEKHVADFYVSDFQSGLRALVKAGYGAKVAPFVKATTVVDITKENRELSPSFLHWLSDRKLSSDERIMRLKEGYIKEGSTVSVMGIVQRQENVLMIVPSPQPPSTGCQWMRCLLPTYIEGLILKCDESQDADVVPV